MPNSWGKFDDKNRKDLLLALLGHNRDELAFWRNRNWEALKYSVTIMAALAGATLVQPGPLDQRRATLVVLVIAATAVAHHAYQRKNVRVYDNLKRDRERLMVALGVNVPDRFIPGSPLFDNIDRGAGPAKGTPLFIQIVWLLAAVLALAEMVQASVDTSHALAPKQCCCSTDSKP